jgi:hypothetical protein
LEDLEKSGNSLISEEISLDFEFNNFSIDIGKDLLQIIGSFRVNFAVAKGKFFESDIKG